MNTTVGTSLLALLCAMLGACGSVREPDSGLAPAANSTQTRNPAAASLDEKSKGVEPWQFCERLLHPQGSYTGFQIRAMFEPPENISQFLSNLQMAADRGLLLQPSFYDEATLGKFFNGSKVTLAKPNAKLGKLSSGVEAHIESDSFPKLAIEVASNCTLEKFKAINGSAAEHVNANGFLIIKVAPDSLITLGDIRRVFGPEQQLFTGRGWDADGHTYTPFDEGSLTYQSVRRAGIEGSRIKTLIHFKLQKMPAAEDSDVVMRIEMHDTQHHILESR